MSLSLPTLRAVSVLDAAFDVAAYDDGGKRYIETRDPALVRELAGKRLTWFVIRALPASLVSGPILEAGSDSRMRHRAFQLGVERVENLHALDGTVWVERSGTGSASTARGVIATWTDAEMDLIHPAYVQELGEVALRRAFLLPHSEPIYRLPPTSAGAWAERVYQCAVALASAAASSARPASVDPAATSESEPRGAATAMDARTASTGASAT